MVTPRLLPYRPRCDSPDFERIAAALAKLGEVANLTRHSSILRSEYSPIAGLRRALTPIDRFASNSGFGKGNGLKSKKSWRTPANFLRAKTIGVAWPPQKPVSKL